MAAFEYRIHKIYARVFCLGSAAGVLVLIRVVMLSTWSALCFKEKAIFHIPEVLSCGPSCLVERKHICARQGPPA